MLEHLGARHQDQHQKYAPNQFLFADVMTKRLIRDYKKVSFNYNEYDVEPGNCILACYDL